MDTYFFDILDSNVRHLQVLDLMANFYGGLLSSILIVNYELISSISSAGN